MSTQAERRPRCVLAIINPSGEELRGDLAIVKPSGEEA